MLSALSKWSTALPFVLRPEKLTGAMVGDCGFDPVGLSRIEGEYINLNWMREAELKHGRVCMLGVVGLIVPYFVRLGGPYYSEANPILAAAKVPPAAWAQILLLIGLLEFYGNAGKMTMGDMFSDSSRVPGNIGFDPLHMKGDAQLELKELKNGRLAMLAFGGMISQLLLTGHPVGIN